MRSDVAFLEVMVVSSSLFYIRSIDVRRGLFKKSRQNGPNWVVNPIGPVTWAPSGYTYAYDTPGGKRGNGWIDGFLMGRFERICT
jgi:hypothetical protein